MNISEGSSKITIGLIDGPVYLDHSAFEDSIIKAIKHSQLVECRSADKICRRNHRFNT